jgi:hypothetical protein
MSNRTTYTVNIKIVSESAMQIFLRAQARTVGRAIAQAVSRRLPTAAARVQNRVWSCGIL